MVSVDNEIKAAQLPNGNKLVLWSFWDDKTGTDIYITEFDKEGEEIKQYVSDWSIEKFKDGDFTPNDVLDQYGDLYNLVLLNIVRKHMDKTYLNKVKSKETKHTGRGWKGEKHRHTLASRGIRSVK